MSETREQLEEIKQLLVKINNSITIKDPTTFLPNEMRDFQETNLPQLIAIINEVLTNFDANHDSQFQLLRTIFTNRWLRIANTELCYTRNFNHPLNLGFCWLAKYIDREHKNSVLMPGVEENHLSGYAFNQLNIGEFTITDDLRNYIPLEALIETACARILNSDEPLYQIINPNGQIATLSNNELNRFGSVIKIINSIQNWRRLQNSSLYTALLTLRNCLLQGDVLHEGAEYNSGAAANVGIANFYAIFASLSEDIKTELCQYSDNTGVYNLGFVLAHLFRDNTILQVEDMSAVYCIQLLGGKLERILEHNALELSRIDVLTGQNLHGLIKLVKSQLNIQNLIVDLTTSNATTNRSKLNPNFSIDEDTWVVSFIAPKSLEYIPLSSKIIVEGCKDGKLFVGSYYPYAESNSPWPLIPEYLQNTPGIFSKIKIFESFGYAKIPEIDREGSLLINETGDIRYKFNLIEELRNSLSRSYRVAAIDAKRMIDSIKKNARQTEFASWLSGPITSGQHNGKIVDRIRASNPAIYSQYIPYERFGSHSFFGSGKDNCVTWCEKKLAIADARFEKKPVTDCVKAKPLFHVFS